MFTQTQRTTKILTTSVGEDNSDIAHAIFVDKICYMSRDESMTVLHMQDGSKIRVNTPIQNLIEEITK